MLPLYQNCRRHSAQALQKTPCTRWAEEDAFSTICTGQQNVPQTAHAGTRNAPGTRLKRLVSFAETPHGPAATRRLAEDLCRFLAQIISATNQTGALAFRSVGHWSPRNCISSTRMHRELHGEPDSLVCIPVPHLQGRLFF